MYTTQQSKGKGKHAAYTLKQYLYKVTKFHADMGFLNRNMIAYVKRE